MPSTIKTISKWFIYNGDQTIDYLQKLWNKVNIYLIKVYFIKTFRMIKNYNKSKSNKFFYYFEIIITKRVIHYLFLIFFMTSDYYESFTENFEENNFEASDIELYRNKQNF